MKSKLTLVFTLLTIAACAQIPSDGLVGYWPFTGNANDASGNGNHGIVNGATLTTDRFGNANSAYNFDGVNDFIEVPVQQIGVLNYSICCWFKYPPGANGENYKGLVQASGAYPNAQYSFNLQISASPLFPNQANHKVSASINGPGVYNGWISNNTYNDNAWHCLVGVLNINTGAQTNSSNIKLYLDGTLIQSNSFNVDYGSITAPVNGQGNTRFGMLNHVFPERYYDGILDDISIYNRALTQEEITQLYNDQTSLVEVPCTPFLGEDQTVCAGTSVTLSASGSSSACPTLPTNLQNGLVGYWPFCGNANDASGNGNHGTVNGATLTTDRFGNLNSAYNFSRINSQYVSGSLTLSGNQFTESIWAKHNTGYTGNCSSPCNEWLISIGQYNPIEVLELGTYFNGNNLSTGKYNDILFQTQAVLSTSWTHYVVTHNNGMNTIYQDGVFKGSYSGAPINLTGNCGFYFGRQWDPYLEFWDGKLDDVSIYNRLLSIAEIQQLFTLGQTTYEWSTGDTTSTIDVSPTETTTYTCAITTNGVTCTDSITVTVLQPTIFYADLDNDGFGSGAATNSCVDLGAGYVTNNTDCDDTNANINTAANEICNDIDDNCDGQIDEGVQTVYFIDNDGDTYGNTSVSILACTQPAGYTPDNTDCDDTNASINPAAEDLAGNGIDENCDGQIDNSIAELANAFILYPNPASTNITLQVNSNLVGKELMIYDATGKLIHQQKILSTLTPISLYQMATGHYMLRIDEEVKQFEIIK